MAEQAIGCIDMTLSIGRSGSVESDFNRVEQAVVFREEQLVHDEDDGQRSVF